jgi:hypothetical protein
MKDAIQSGWFIPCGQAAPVFAAVHQIPKQLVLGPLQDLQKKCK